MFQAGLLLSLLLLKVLDDNSITCKQLADSVKADEIAGEDVEEEEGEEDEDGPPAEEKDAEVDGSQLEDEGRGQQGQLREDAWDQLQEIHDLPLDLFHRGLFTGILPNARVGVADDLVASLADQQQAGDHRQNLGRLRLLAGDLNEVNLDTHLDDTPKEDLRSVKGDDLGFSGFVFIPNEEENIKLLCSGLADLAEKEGAARVDAAREEELEELQELHYEEGKKEEKAGPQ